ncbi:hypothetical protein [Floridanema aerugineum]|uniref:Uncharacterized protein n=1 Tax=Floridaenema aerugineum BLCC-F46 TaxID=3153654 RepID=A0ABV4X2M9_9CYAN
MECEIIHQEQPYLEITCDPWVFGQPRPIPQALIAGWSAWVIYCLTKEIEFYQLNIAILPSTIVGIVQSTTINYECD